MQLHLITMIFLLLNPIGKFGSECTVWFSYFELDRQHLLLVLIEDVRKEAVSEFLSYRIYTHLHNLGVGCTAELDGLDLHKGIGVAYGALTTLP